MLLQGVCSTQGIMYGSAINKTSQLFLWKRKIVDHITHTQMPASLLLFRYVKDYGFISHFLNKDVDFLGKKGTSTGFAMYTMINYNDLRLTLDRS